MGLCSGDEDCPVLESTQAVRSGPARKFTSEFSTVLSAQSWQYFIITERWFGNTWKEVELVLYSDSVLAWYDAGDRSSMLGGAKLVLSPDLIAAGQYTANIPDRPDLPSRAGLAQLLAVGSRPSNNVTWLLLQSEQEVGEWMKVMAATLQPFLPQQQQQAPTAPPEYPPPYNPAPPPPPPNQAHHGHHQGHHGHHQGHHQGHHHGHHHGHHGQQHHQGPYPRQAQGQYGGGGGHTTVIYGGDRRDSGPGFGTGFGTGVYSLIEYFGEVLKCLFSYSFLFSYYVNIKSQYWMNNTPLTGLLAGGLMGYGMGGGFGGFGLGNTNNYNHFLKIQSNLNSKHIIFNLYMTKTMKNT